ncbi:transposase [Actinophytocola sp.]|uniref:IS110 family transposase n=1 Tax=Actinophytocola sp. TaxID=1872138 RepID=UPI00389A4E95
MSGLWAGIDWSEHLNDLAVVDKAGMVVARARVAETPHGVKEVMRLLAGLRSSHRHSRKDVPIAIETSRGLLVEALRAAGQPVVPINPVVVANHRKLAAPATVKSDRGDAALLANILRVDGHRHRPLPANTDTVNAVAELSRTQLQAHHTRQLHYNRLRSVLREVHPAACRAWSDLPGNLLRPEARAILALAPTPTTAARLTKRQLRETLAAAGRTRLVDAHANRLHALFREPALRHRAVVENALGVRVRVPRRARPRMRHPRRTHHPDRRRVPHPPPRAPLPVLPRRWGTHRRPAPRRDRRRPHPLPPRPGPARLRWRGPHHLGKQHLRH